jgi:hypothetical protein
MAVRFFRFFRQIIKTENFLAVSHGCHRVGADIDNRGLEDAKMIVGYNDIGGDKERYDYES